MSLPQVSTSPLFVDTKFYLPISCQHLLDTGDLHLVAWNFYSLTSIRFIRERGSWRAERGIFGISIEKKNPWWKKIGKKQYRAQVLIHLLKRTPLRRKTFQKHRPDAGQSFHVWPHHTESLNPTSTKPYFTKRNLVKSNLTNFDPTQPNLTKPITSLNPNSLNP